MTVKILNRTATFAWGTSADSLPLIATGTVSGALDETFSNVGSLEIWQPEFFGEKGAGEGLYLGGEGQPGPRGSISTHARYVLGWDDIQVFETLYLICTTGSTDSPGQTHPANMLGDYWLPVWRLEKYQYGMQTRFCKDPSMYFSSTIAFH
jgi:hypothetical protein